MEGVKKKHISKYQEVGPVIPNGLYNFKFGNNNKKNVLYMLHALDISLKSK